jgi:hypothetical protein
MTDTYDLRTDYAREFSAARANYISIRLEPTVVRELPTADWEFNYDTDTGRRHLRSVHWLAGGHEYFVYGSMPVELWPDTQWLLDVMLTHSTP